MKSDMMVTITLEPSKAARLVAITEYEPKDINCVIGVFGNIKPGDCCCTLEWTSKLAGVIHVSELPHGVKLT